MRMGPLLFIVGMTAGGLLAGNAAVLPFANRTATAGASHANMDWIGESIAETVRDALGPRGVVTLSREEVDEAYRHLSLRPRGVLTGGSVLKIGEALDAEQVIYGTFEFSRELAPDSTVPSAAQPGSL